MAQSPPSMASEDARDDLLRECLHKTKVIQFLGRTTPIILQNENGPCPLLSICNVLLLKNNLNLGPDLHEVSQEKLLSLVAERLIDANSNFEDKDHDYSKNQQQNIADAIDLLPRLTTGIDVNLKFTGIRDFEFTPECAIFDLLDIPLYHGWIVDPQDHETATAIGSKSYNIIMSELVSLETRAMDGSYKNDFIDLSAATTAALGIPSPSLSRGRSFDESHHIVAEDDINMKKGDLEENAALLRAINLSADPYSSSKDDSASAITNKQNVEDSEIGVETLQISPSGSSDHESQATLNAEKNGTGPVPSATNDHENQTYLVTTYESVCSAVTVVEGQERLSHETNPLMPCIGDVEKFAVGDVIQNEYGNGYPCDKMSVNDTTGTLVQGDTETFVNPDSGPASTVTNHMLVSGTSNSLPDDSTSTSSIKVGPIDRDAPDTEDSNLVIAKTDSKSISGRGENVDEATVPCIEAEEPIYEGEEFMLDSEKRIYENHEPMYEGEVILAEQAEHGTLGGSTVSCNDELTPTQGELVQNFLKTNASQLTISGLFALQEGLKERELCVFFRNNHFNTMFKYDGELYLLATDQGYINQPDLVWEKLNEVNGNTVFMTSCFKDFKLGSHIHSETWNEQNAMASTADYLVNMDNAAKAGSNFSSDLQLAIALQQQEFEQQQQPQRHSNQQQPQQAPVIGSSRLVTGPQVRRNNERSSSSSSAKQEPKNKEKCSIM
uniref:MINDY deubiquitinase domain-containing protein n=1 Tax=Kalanchoe fedtschenkoi TaxID=63787 RepID=A0A7N0UQG4_KALFE